MENNVQFDLEMTVIGTLMLYPKLVAEAITLIDFADFSITVTREIFSTMCYLHLAGEPISRMSVLLKLGNDYAQACDMAAGCVCLEEQLHYFCEELRSGSRLRTIRQEGEKLALVENNDHADLILDKLNRLQVSKKKVEVMNATEAALDFCSRQDNLEPQRYLPWGFKELDESLYAQLGDFVVVGGYPSAGKTMLSIQFALSMAKEYSIGYFSLETSTQKLIDRLISHLAQIPLSHIKDRALNESEWERVAKATSELTRMKIHFIDAGGMTVRDIQAQTLAGRYQVIVVDYLQLIHDSGHGRYEQVTNISIGLHTLARKHNIAVIALAQLSRAEKQQGVFIPPSLSSFRESGQIEQDADIAFLLWPSDPNNNRSSRILKVGKNKEGERLKLELGFDGNMQTFKVEENSERP